MLFELTDALLCAQGPVKALAELSHAAEHRRGHSGIYAALNQGDLEPQRLRRTLIGTPLTRLRDGRITLAVDVNNWLRPDTATSPGRLFCHTCERGHSRDQFIPGWPYSFVAALQSGPTSWTALLDAVRLSPNGDATEVAMSPSGPAGPKMDRSAWLDSASALVAFHDPVDHVGQPTFECSAGFGGSLAFSDLAQVIVLAAAAVADLADDDRVQDRVQRAVAAGLEPVADVVAAGGVQRCAAHPSVVMWCIANEPDAGGEKAREYFAPLFAETRKLDPTRPVGFTNMVLDQPDSCVLSSWPTCC